MRKIILVLALLPFASCNVNRCDVTPRSKYQLFLQLQKEFKSASDSCTFYQNKATPFCKKGTINVDSFLKYIRKSEWFLGELHTIHLVQSKYLNADSCLSTPKYNTHNE